MELNDFYKFLLNAAVYVPLVCAVCLSALFPFFGNRSAKAVGLFSAGVSLVAAIVLWIAFSTGWAVSAGFAFATSPEIMGIVLPTLALNAISMPMFALAAIVGFAASLWAARSEIHNATFYFILLMLMQGGLMGAFSTTNVMWMYIFHEFALIPTFIGMTLWGGAGKRMAAMQMAIYLTLGALVSLVGIIALFMQCGADDFSLFSIAVAIAKTPLNGQWQHIVFGLLMFGLGTLVSLFPFYTWAPRAYSAAPTSFAMLHAGVLKKFGLYVLIQVAIPFLPKGCAQWAFILAVLALFNVVYIGLVTMAQRDLKMMVSYSSVAHMGLCFLGIASLSVLGVGGTILLMFGHGASVALMFMLSNAIVNRTGQWDMFKMGGLYRQTPVLAGFFIAATLASLGLPGFANFWGELTILTSLWSFSPAICAVAATGLVISAVYGLRAVANVFMGKPSEAIEAKFQLIPDMSLGEKIPAIILLAALLFVGFFPKSVTSGLDADLSAIPTLTQSK